LHKIIITMKRLGSFLVFAPGSVEAMGTERILPALF